MTKIRLSVVIPDVMNALAICRQLTPFLSREGHQGLTLIPISGVRLVHIQR